MEYWNLENTSICSIYIVKFVIQSIKSIYYKIANRTHPYVSEMQVKETEVTRKKTNNKSSEIILENLLFVKYSFLNVRPDP